MAHDSTFAAAQKWSAAPVQTRKERFASTDPEQFPEVSAALLEWRLTPLDRIASLVADSLDGSPYAVSTNIATEWVPMHSDIVGSAGCSEDKVSARAWSSTTSALHIVLDGDDETPARVERILEGTRAAHVVIEFAAHSRRTLVFSNHGSVALAENVEIIVRDGAHATAVFLGEWDDASVHVASHFAVVGRDAHLKHILVSLGGSLQRVNPNIVLNGKGSSADALGVYFADAGQHIEHRVFVHHEAANTTSRVNYKGALHGDGAHTVWVGDVLIGPDASGTDSYEQNRNLVLSEGTRADSVPNLEIQTGDIAGAGHASATGRFDDEHLFYLRSRGISEKEARRLVVLGFLLEVVNSIGVAELEERLGSALEEELNRIEDAA